MSFIINIEYSFLGGLEPLCFLSFCYIFGKIIYEGNNEIIVEAKNIHTKDTRQTVPDKYGQYKFHNLDVGYYQLWAYENINPINESYFNGLMDPLRLAASFGYYNEIIETRAKWDIEDIRIKIK